MQWPFRHRQGDNCTVCQVDIVWRKQIKQNKFKWYSVLHTFKLGLLTNDHHQPPRNKLSNFWVLCFCILQYGKTDRWLYLWAVSTACSSVSLVGVVFNLDLLRDKKLKSEQNNMQYPCGTHSDVNGTTLGCNTSGENLTEKDDLYEGTTSTVFSVCIGLIGIFGNSFAVFILFRSAKSGNSKSGKLVNVLLINQSVIDLTASMFLVMMGYNKTESVIVSFSGLADLYCKLIGSQLPLWMMSITSSWNLALVNLERYLSIVYPIFHKTGITKCHTVVSITVVWLIGPTFDFPYIYFTSGYRNGTCVTTGIWPNYTVAVVVVVIGLLVQVLLPLIIMIGLYLSMMKVIRTKIANRTSVNQNSKGNRLTSRTRNILKTLAVVTFIFVVCYAPNWTPLFSVHCRPDRCFKWRFLFFYCIFGICKLLCKSNYLFSSVQGFSDGGEETLL